MTIFGCSPIPCTAPCPAVIFHWASVCDIEMRCLLLNQLLRYPFFRSVIWSGILLFCAGFVVADEPSNGLDLSEFFSTGSQDSTEIFVSSSVGEVPDRSQQANFVIPSGSYGRNYRFDQALVAQGHSAFQSACTVCHEANRSYEKRKSLSGWTTTVRRMAAKDGADVPVSEINAIAIYLESLHAHSTTQSVENGLSGDKALADSDEEASDDIGLVDSDPPVSISATLSTLFRDADSNHVIENEGFFVDAWVGADWQPEGPLSGRAMACTSCHSNDTSVNGGGFAFELVEASATLDLIQAVKKTPSECGWEAKLKAGRFRVPFGAFAAMSHPGVYRTLTNPLMYNMGRRVFGTTGLAAPPRQPVLPMPYADEGADVRVKIPLVYETSATFDIYAVNGLQQSGPDLRFFQPSRSYTDNNSLPAFGGRLRVGNPCVQVGGSFMTGEAQPDGTTSGPVRYQLSGADLTAKFKDWLRVYLEYAIRTNTKKLSPFHPPDSRRTMAYGLVAEAEVKLWDQPRLGLLGRYDTLAFRDILQPSSPAGPEIERITWGLNVALSGSSLLILNHERWILPNPDDEIDVVGFRWVAVF